MASTSASASASRSATARKSSRYWTTFSSASQEIEGSKRRITVGRATYFAGLASCWRIAPPRALTIGSAVGMGSIGFLPTIQQPSPECGAVVDIAVAVASAALDEKASETIDVDAWCVLGGESAVGGGRSPVFGRLALSRPPICTCRLLIYGWTLAVPVWIAWESSDSWIPVFLFHPCDTVAGDMVVVDRPAAPGQWRALDGLGVPDKRV
jgi:hypothetical protein